MKSLSTALAQRHQQGLYRQRRVMHGQSSVHMQLAGQPVINFCSNDYLGLASDPRLIAALADGARRYGVGSGASHLVTGHHAIHDALEQALAEFTGRPRALLFSTGYMANLGVITTLAGRHDRIFSDRLNHASLLDGARLSGATMQRYPHHDMAALHTLLAEPSTAQTLVVSDGVFSMDGDIAPLPQLMQLAHDSGSWLIIDDAHGFGVLGAHGGGTFEHCSQPHSDNVAVIGTFGKAFGTSGAFVAGSDALIETLIQNARSYIYTTALSPALAHATLVSLGIVRDEDWRRQQLRSLIERFRRGAAQLGLTLGESTTPIQPLIIGDNARCVAASERLLAAGLLISAIRPPTVPHGTARLRITLSAAHREVDIDRLLDALSGL
ncbi:MAG: 8-amino-7-oxononanoate synthase [Gammaproteobacteria bacterium]|nr:8-amino-7-oxononanoate synthase [Gammaproteobacteria bacterium]